MKKLILSVIVLMALFSCKKDKTTTCETSVAGIAGNYKITKVELTSTSGSSDVSGTYLNDCTKNALYQLKADKTLTYTEEGSTCTGSGSGVWNVSNNLITTSGTGYNFDDATIKSWNCTLLIISSPFSSGTTLDYTFTKQ